MIEMWINYSLFVEAVDKSVGAENKMHLQWLNENNSYIKEKKIHCLGEFYSHLYKYYNNKTKRQNRCIISVIVIQGGIHTKGKLKDELNGDDCSCVRNENVFSTYIIIILNEAQGDKLTVWRKKHFAACDCNFFKKVLRFMCGADAKRKWGK